MNVKNGTRKQAEALAAKLNGWLDVGQFVDGSIDVELVTTPPNTVWENCGGCHTLHVDGPHHRDEGSRAEFWGRVVAHLREYVTEGLKPVVETDAETRRVLGFDD